MDGSKKHIVISTDMEDLGVSVTVDGKSITSHFEVDMVKAIERLLDKMGVSKEKYDIEDKR